MSEYVRLNENGIYNKTILSEALDIKKTLVAAERSLERIAADKYAIAEIRYSDMPGGGLHENICYSEREEAKIKEISEIKESLSIAQLHVKRIIAELPLSDDKKKLLRECFANSNTIEEAFEYCNMSRAVGYRKLHSLLNELVL